VNLDPRERVRLPDRDLRALRFIGEGYEVAQYQLHEAIFSGLSEVVVSRRVRRWRALGHVAVERWNRIGMNRLRLTRRGKGFLVTNRVKGELLFVPRAPLSPRVIPHTLWINDVRIALARMREGWDEILPAWTLERTIVPRLRAVPDVLALRRETHQRRVLALAVEVDLGTEPLKSVFLPKLTLLEETLLGLEINSTAAVILTSSLPRAVTIFRAAPMRRVPLVCEVLPEVQGRKGLEVLVRLFTRPVQTNELPEVQNMTRTQSLERKVATDA
jgi:hypothetical protein